MFKNAIPNIVVTYEDINHICTFQRYDLEEKAK